MAKKEEWENEKTYQLAACHFLPDPSNTMLDTMSHGVLEVAIRKGGWWWQMRKHERWHDSEVAVKKTLMKCSWALTMKGKAIWKWSIILESAVEIQNQSVQKNPKQPKYRHRWCSDSNILAQGHGHDNLNCRPAWASLTMQILISRWLLYCLVGFLLSCLIIV